MRVRRYDLALALHGLRRVAHDVEHDLDQLLLVAMHFRQAQIVIALDDQTFGQFGQHHAAHAFQHLVDIERTEMGRVLRREQFFHQRAQTVRFLDDDLGIFAQRRFFQFLLQQLRRAAYAAQRVLDFVRQIAQQQTIGLRLVQHLFFARQFQRPVYGVKFQQQRIRAELQRSCGTAQVQLDSGRMRAERKFMFNMAGMGGERILDCCE